MQKPPLGERTCRRFSFLINFAFWALWIGLFFAAGRLLIRLLLPFVTAFLLAAILQRPMRFLESRYRLQHRFASTAAAVGALVLLGGVLAGICWQGCLFFLRLLQSENTLAVLEQFGGSIGNAVTALFGFFEQYLPPEFAAAASRVAAAVSDALYTAGADVLSAVSGTVMTFATDRLPRLLLAVLFFILAFVFFVRDFDQTVRFLRRQIPPPQQPLVSAAVRATKDTCGGIVRAYLLLGLLTFAELSVGFWLIGLPHPVLSAAATAVVDALPVLGVGTVLLPFAAFRLIGGNISGGLWVLALYTVVAAVRNFLQPRLVSRETGLPPLATLLTMYAGWRAAGFVGLLVAPIAAMVVLRLQREGHLHIFH